MNVDQLLLGGWMHVQISSSLEEQEKIAFKRLKPKDM
jgi:hypothetical protein